MSMGKIEEKENPIEFPLMDILVAINRVSTSVELNTQAIKNLSDSLSKEIDAKIIKLEFKYASVLIVGLFVVCGFFWKLVIPGIIEDLVPQIVERRGVELLRRGDAS